MAVVLQDVELEKAMEDLHQYLSDYLPPLIVMDSIAILMDHPPTQTASALESWASGFVRQDTDVSLSDLLYHAVLKIYRMHEYKLVSARKFIPFVAALKQSVLEYCPAEERQALEKNFQLLGTTPMIPSGGSVIVSRSGNGPRAAYSQSDKEEQAYRIGYLLTRLANRLEGLSSGNTGATASAALPAKQAAALNEALVDIARTAKEASELRHVLGHLKQELGVEAGPEDLFLALGRTLPGWSLPSAGGGDKEQVQLPSSSNLQAMHRMVTTAEEPREAVANFHHLLHSAIDRFNEGSLVQACSILDVATGILKANEVDPETVTMTLSRAHEKLHDERMRQYTEIQHFRPLLQKVLRFFSGLNWQSMLDDLYRCQKRERRKLLLALLECHGQPVRQACLAHLQQPLGHGAEQAEVWYRRNLIHLLKRIPMPASENLEETAETLLAYIDPSLDFLYSPLIIKETLAYLPQLKHPKVEQVMIRALDHLNMQICRPSAQDAYLREQHQYANRVSGALIRFGTPTARAAVLNHALTKKLGNEAHLALAEFSNVDLSDDMETVDRLCDALQAHLPLKRLGILLEQRDQAARALAGALSGTSVPRVRRLLEELAERYPETEAGRAAEAILSSRQQAKGRRATDGPAASLTGDLEVFGLPYLLQTLSDNTLTGTLVIRNADEVITATVSIAAGKFRACQNGRLNGDAAMYQLFEKPQPGSFQFVRSTDGNASSSSPTTPLLQLIIEGMRRYDELQQLRNQAPDGFRLKAVGSKPVPLPEEKDGLLFRSLWLAVLEGRTPAQCEADAAADAYRVRRLLVHWLQSGVVETAA